MSTQNEYVVEVSKFKGHPTLSILKGDKRIISFGVKKAKAILENIEAIRQFVFENFEPDSSEE